MLTRESWGEFDCYLFDIDGTLLHSRDAVHYFALLHCLRGLSGQDLTLEGIPVHGSTDPRIVGDAMRAAGFADAVWKKDLPAALTAMASQVTDRRHEMRVDVLPGVLRTLELLRNRGAVLGVATGNLEAIGWLKVEAGGLREFFSFGSFSDRHEHRRDTFREAKRMGQERCGENATICVVGDTPADVQAARENAMPVIAVSTGIFSGEELRAAGADLCVPTLEELLPAIATTP
jgi:phosphoglycolate phosphatase